MNQEAQPLLRVSAVKKQFGGISALSDVSFDIERGCCIALVGENGAGKSTLMKILSGVWPQGTFTGELRFAGEPLHLKSPLDARKAGISIIHQELCLFPHLTVAENLLLTEAPPFDGSPSASLFQAVGWPLLYAKASQLLEELGFEISAHSLVKDLSVAERQMVEIARAVHHQARLLILDEPTSALSTREVHRLFEVLDRMKASQVTLIYISHKLDEVFRLADRIVVLRDGRTVADLNPKETTPEEVVRYMVGRPILDKRYFEASVPAAEPLLEIEGLGHVLSDGHPRLEGIGFSVAPGEIVGVAGLMGSGRSELLRSLVGVLPGKRTGLVRFDGKVVDWKNVSESLDAGVSFVPEDRKKDGLCLDLGVGFNLSLSILRMLSDRLGLVDANRERNRAEELRRYLTVRCGTLAQSVKSLSGGNQQKVLLGKMVARGPRLLLLDEPTRGIDIGAKGEIYEIIAKLAAEGMAIMVVSSELPEILALSHRVVVLREGRQVGVLENQGLTQETILSLAIEKETL